MLLVAVGLMVTIGLGVAVGTAGSDSPAVSTCSRSTKTSSIEENCTAGETTTYLSAVSCERLMAVTVPTYKPFGKRESRPEV